MQLAITALGNLSTDFIAELLSVTRDCKCSIVEIRTSCLSKSRAAYLLVQGNWNQIAKLEKQLEHLHKHLAVQIHSLRTDQEEPVKEKSGLPYVLETFSIDKDSVIESIGTFLFDRGVEVEEIVGSRYLAAYSQTLAFSIRFILLIPAQLPLMSFREDLLDYCDQLNLDALLEPIKR
jgi:glycine cleavage system transcriptional repressor